MDALFLLMVTAIVIVAGGWAVLGIGYQTYCGMRYGHAWDANGECSKCGVRWSTLRSLE